MSTKNRYVNTEFWRDEYIEDLNPLEKYLFLYCITNPMANIGGIYKISIKRISYETALKKEEVLQIFDKFKDDHKILYLDGYVVCRNTIKHQKMNDNMKKGIEKIINNSPTHLVEWLCGDALVEENGSLSIDFERLSNPSNYININLIKYNINANESKDSKSKKKQPDEKPKKKPRKKYLDYDDIKQYRDNIWIREHDYNALIDKYGRKQTEKMIEKLSGYKLANDKTYASDYGAIIQWVRESCGVQPIGGDGPKNLNYEDVKDIEF